MTIDYDSHDWEKPEKPATQGTKPRGSGWWLTTTSPAGKFVVMGPYQTEEEASNYGFQHFGTNFDTHQLNTRDMQKATHILKRWRYDRIKDLDLALEKASYKG